MILMLPGTANAGGCATSGSTLQIAADELDSEVGISRSGASIQVTIVSQLSLERDPLPIACTGPAPTVNTIDTIVVAGSDAKFASHTVQLSLEGGPLSPGLTSEVGGGSEIELAFSRVSGLAVNGGDGPDNLAFGLVSGVAAANLNDDEPVPDVDLLMPPFSHRGRMIKPDFEVRGGAGDDRITAAGGPGFDAKLRTSFGAEGGSGADQLTGSSGEDGLVGQGGDDVLRGLGVGDGLFSGRGRDTVEGGGGGDVIFSGPGRDRIEGGKGSDLIWSGPGRDRVKCGPGRDALARPSGRADRRRGCEFLISLKGFFDH